MNRFFSAFLLLLMIPYMAFAIDLATIESELLPTTQPSMSLPKSDVSQTSGAAHVCSSGESGLTEARNSANWRAKLEQVDVSPLFHLGLKIINNSNTKRLRDAVMPRGDGRILSASDIKGKLCKRDPNKEPFFAGELLLMPRIYGTYSQAVVMGYASDSLAILRWSGSEKSWESMLIPPEADLFVWPLDRD